MVKRELINLIKKGVRPGFINIIYGPRRVGKTVLLEQLVEGIPEQNTIWFNGDTEETRNSLNTTSQIRLSKFVEKYKTVIIDEAQRIENIGLSLKILIDSHPKKTFFVTGSSSLMLSRGIQEPLTGRSLKYRLYPFSTSELTQNLKDYEKTSLLEEQLLFGGYPYLQNLAQKEEKKLYLKSIIDDYLFRDVLLLKDVASPETLKKLASLLAFQIGSEVSLNELANNLKIDVKTVVRYLSLLKQSFIIFELPAFSNNPRKEVAKSKKYFFWDLGIRNALIDQFQTFDTRVDTGALWENFLAVERVKKHEYEGKIVECYFWRTYQKAEIDWIEVADDKISAYEFKFKNKKIHTPKVFKEKYTTSLELISKENYQDFV